MGVVWISLLTILVVCQTSPVPHRLKYDQRQEGKWNVRADLENFIFLVIPTFPSSSAAASGGLMDFLFKTLPLPSYKKTKKHVKVHHQHEDGALPDTEEFLESKTAPYHVDISRTKDHLAKLHPEVAIPENVKEEIIIARSPSVALSKSQENSEEKEENLLRNSRAIVITVPMENENIQRHSLKDVVGGKGGEDIKKTLGISVDAIEKGLALAAETQKNPLKTDELQAFEVVPNKDTTYDDNIKKIADQVRATHAIVLAKTVHVGLVEYFRKVAEKLRERHEAEKLLEEEKEEENEKKSLPKPLGNLRSKVRKAVIAVKEKRQEKEKSGFKEENTPKVDLVPPKILEENKPTEASKENSKEQLLLLGAELEQCGPGRERDSLGICKDSAVKS